MARKKPFMPYTDLGKQQLFGTLSIKLPLYKEKYNIIQAEIDDIVNAKLNIDYVITCRKTVDDWLKTVTEYRNELWYDEKGGIKVMPPFPPLPPPPPPIAAGIVDRAIALAVGIKSKFFYVVSDGKDMGIEGLDILVDRATQKPVLKGKLLANGVPQFRYLKGLMDGVKFQVDRGDGIWAEAGTSGSNKFVDKAALPAAGTAKVLKFRGIYVVDEEHIGQWSDIVSITVTGV